MTKPFNCQNLVAEFVRYANLVCPHDEQLGMCELEINFTEINGRLNIAVIPIRNIYNEDMYLSAYESHICRLLERTLDDLNFCQAFPSIGKKRTFILYSNDLEPALLYSVGGVK